MKYYAVHILVEFEAETPEDATRLAQSYVDHIVTTGPDADLVAPEAITVARTPVRI